MIRVSLSHSRIHSYIFFCHSQNDRITFCLKTIQNTKIYFLIYIKKLLSLMSLFSLPLQSLSPLPLYSLLRLIFLYHSSIFLYYSLSPCISCLSPSLLSLPLSYLLPLHPFFFFFIIPLLYQTRCSVKLFVLYINHQIKWSTKSCPVQLCIVRKIYVQYLLFGYGTSQCIIVNQTNIRITST